MVKKLKKNTDLIHHSRPFFDAGDENSIIQVLHDRYISSGRKAAFLGKVGAQLLRRKWAIPVQSGTDALVSALKILGLKEGAKVAVPAYICSAPLDALAFLGLRPVPVDIDRNTMAVDAELVNCLKGLEAVIAAHLFGIPAPLHEIRNDNLIEDCAQTLGVKSGARTVGSMGRLSICSFYATKLVTSGHGGMIAGDETGLYRKAMDLFDHDNRDNWEPHLHFRMSDLNAALGISQLKKLDRFISDRRRIASRYAEALGQRKSGNSIFSRFLVVPAKGDAGAVIKMFEKAGIEAKRPVFKPVYIYLGEPARRFPNSAWAHEKIVSIPIYPGMEESHVERIAELLERRKDDLRCWPPA